MENQNINKAVSNLQKEINLLKRKNGILLSIFTILLGLSVCLNFFDSSVYSSEKEKRFENLRTRQLVVEDENGNDRIVISPKITNTKSRQRTDTLDGVLILDEKGIDRTVLGAVPTFQNNKRISKRINNGVPYGFVFNDEKGDERGGFGYYSDRQLASLGMDSSGGEGMALFVAEDNLYGQKLGIIMNENGQKVYLGSNKAGDVVFNLDAPQKARLEFIVDSKGKATAKHYDLRKNLEKVLFKSE